MPRVKLTAGRIADFEFNGKQQSFLWDCDVPGLGVRATVGAKNYIFQARVNSKTLRVTIGDVRAWSIFDAQVEARRLQVLIDNGHDPRQVKADTQAANDATKAANIAASVRDSLTLSDVWPVYIAERTPRWGERHTNEHLKMIKAGGEHRTRSKVKLTKPAPLAALAGLRLVDLTTARIETWAKTEALTRPTHARLAWRMLKAFLTWCAAHPIYAEIIQTNPAKNKKVREAFGKAKPKNDVLQREQLPAWFTAVKQISNPVISAYLQCLLISGARREELGRLQWEDCDFQWKSLTIRDKVNGQRIIPMTPYMEHLLAPLPRRNAWIFSSHTAKSGRLADPTKAHNRACAIAGLDVTLHGLRRSFASLCEWIETPSGISAQIQGHAPQGVREQNYIRRPLDLLRMWHVKIEAWILDQAQIEFVPITQGLRLVSKA